MNILITGATGLVGQNLVKELLVCGHHVTAVSRSKSKVKALLPQISDIIECDLGKNKISSDLQKIDCVVHLMGESVASGRWNQNRKNEIYNSRILSTKNLVESFSTAPKIFISASAIGIYGDRRDEILNEDSTLGDDFLAKVCKDWEVEAKRIQFLSKSSPMRSIQIRTGLVLSPLGGALQKMLPAFRLGLGGALGNGQHWVSWIHIRDLVRLIGFVIDHTNVAGAINAVSPNPVRNIDFSRQLAKTLHRFLGPSLPVFALKILFGEMASVLLASQNVSAKKIINYGFKFEFPELEMALRDVCCREFE